MFVADNDLLFYIILTTIFILSQDYTVQSFHNNPLLKAIHNDYLSNKSLMKQLTQFNKISLVCSTQMFDTETCIGTTCRLYNPCVMFMNYFKYF